ncbi:hypothetical protein EBR21_16885 [bacterium]|nr:hypothetical protein [bacterium]
MGDGPCLRGLHHFPHLCRKFFVLSVDFRSIENWASTITFATIRLQKASVFSHQKFVFCENTLDFRGVILPRC